MVAVIKTGHSIQRILNYNENKVKEGIAQCIGEGNYPMDITDMSFSVKLKRLVQQAELNNNVSRNSVHISLNFDPSEVSLTQEKLMLIASEYMEKIGFGNQPYLVYQHHDAGHPHIHIVSLKVRPDGSRIDMQNIGRNQSEAARIAIEKKYGLIAASGKKNTQDSEQSPIAITKVMYGKTQTKRAITNVLDAVLPNYKYTSLHELNAILGQYNVRADRGTENSRVFQNNGLLYRILDKEGNAVGVPIKASAIYNRPTLPFLEQYYKPNELARAAHKARLKNTIDRLFLVDAKPSLQVFFKALEKEGVNAVTRKSDNGIIYGITYIDHRTKCAFNGSALGKQYSAKAIQERCIAGKISADGQKSKSQEKGNKKLIEQGVRPENPESIYSGGFGKLADLLTKSENTLEYVPGRLKGKKKKKKRRGQSDN